MSPGSQAVGQPLQYNRGIAGDGVEAAPGPGYVVQPHPRHHGIEHRIPDAHWRAEEAWRVPGNAAKHGLRCTDLPPQCRRSVKTEESGVAHAVILDTVAASDDIPDDVGMRGGLVADTEETCRGAVAVEDVEHLGRDFRMRAVVEGDGNFSAARRCSGRRMMLSPSRRLLGHIPISPKAM